MKEKKIENSCLSDPCPIRDVLCRLGDKWSLLILVNLDEHGTMRFGEMEKSIGDISHRMLTVTLRSLERDGLICRKIFAEVPPRVEYSLTNLGKSLLPPVNRLIDWAMENLDTIYTNRRAYS